MRSNINKLINNNNDCNAQHTSYTKITQMLIMNDSKSSHKSVFSHLIFVYIYIALIFLFDFTL